MPDRTPHEPLVLGLDVGTQSLRAALVDLQGRTVAFGVAPIETTYPAAELGRAGPDQWWTAARDGRRRRRWRRPARRPDGSRRSAWTAPPARSWPATSTASRFAPPCSGWISGRTARPTTISATGDPVLRYVSGRVSPEWMLPKALWLKRNEPETYERADRIVECTNWFMYRLTGEWTLSLNHCAGEVELRPARRRLAARR